MIEHKIKHNKEERELLKNMGVPEWLLKPTVISPKESCPLDSVGLSTKLIQNCEEAGLTSLFAVQKAVIPAFLKRQSLYDTRRGPGDLCVSAPTGSGKTLAYVLPIVDILSKRVVTRLRAVVVLPTRDLVTQVTETFHEIARGTPLIIASASGQHSFEHEQRMLVDSTGKENYLGGKSKVDILITTPGRLLDHLTLTPNFTLQHLRYLVIDEADRLLNLSFHDWLNRILIATQPEANANPPHLSSRPMIISNVIEPDAVAPYFLRSKYDLPSTDLDIPKVQSVQKLLFSATLTKNPAKIAELHLNEPEYISVQDEGGSEKKEYTTPEGLKEHLITCSTEDKPLTFIYLLHNIGLTSGLCFTKSIESTQKLRLLLDAYESTQPEEKRMVVREYSSDIRPKERKLLIKKFKAGEINVLICSDLIGRGIDLDTVQFVVSYDVPLYMDKYIHRVGRTARAGREGEAYTIAEYHEAQHFRKILRHAGHLKQLTPYKIEKDKLKELTADYEKAIQSLAE
ncbi:P-loop containing nucleoside triphosphate hydrolase protein [Pilobolus umbonatus]|nr:P-loop containing nucleoside triphosphate hydrolase protein [Pilobolus umbonatus]